MHDITWFNETIQTGSNKYSRLCKKYYVYLDLLLLYTINGENAIFLVVFLLK